jgi:hypothetical protein
VSWGADRAMGLGGGMIGGEPGGWVPRGRREAGREVRGELSGWARHGDGNGVVMGLS